MSPVNTLPEHVRLAPECLQLNERIHRCGEMKPLRSTVKPRPKLRKFCKWTGLVLCAVLLAVWIGSRWYRLSWSSSGDRFGIYLFNQGWFGCYFFDGANPSPGGLYLGATTERKLMWGFSQREYAIASGGTMWYAMVPLWFPLLISSACTVWVWRVDRRLSRIGMCTQCGYDLSGLPGKACPECGGK